MICSSSCNRIWSLIQIVVILLHQRLKNSFLRTEEGSTCATVLTRAIFSEGCKSVAAGVNAMELRRGISMAVDIVVTNLKSRARMISTSDEITQVGTISANREREKYSTTVSNNFDRKTTKNSNQVLIIPTINPTSFKTAQNLQKAFQPGLAPAL